MVSCDMLYDINRRLQEIFVSTDLFGGRSVMIVGDILQLPPVKARSIFSKPFSSKNRSLFNSPDNLWRNFKVVTLTDNQRQGIGEYTNCLNRIRTGDANNEDKLLLEKRRLKHFPELDTSQACHVFFTNAEVDSHNRKMLNSINEDLISVQAGGIYPKGVKPIITENGIVENTPFLKNLCLKKGARVMLTFNVDLSDSLVNGVLGTVLDFVIENSKVKAVIISFDNPDVGLQQMRDNAHDCSAFKDKSGCPIYRTTLEHTMKKYGGARGKTIQFPLRLSWASTTHKLQGTTIEKGSDLVVHGHKKMPKSMYYVMLSRCASLDNLYLANDVNLDAMLCDPVALEEKLRMDGESIAPKLLKEPLDIFYVNIRSFQKHQADLKVDIFAKQAACLCLVETWIKPDDVIAHDFDEKTMFEASVGHGKGCCALLPPDGQCHSKIINDSFQLLSFIFNNIQIVIVYVSKEPDLKCLKTSLKETFIADMKKVLIGDFNFDVKETNIVTSFLKMANFHQLVDKPTHTAGRTIDHLYVSPELKKHVEFTVMFKYYTDHSAFHVQIKT